MLSVLLILYLYANKWNVYIFYTTLAFFAVGSSHFRYYKHTLTDEERATRPKVPDACCDLEAKMLEPSINTRAAFQLGLLSNFFSKLSFQMAGNLLNLREQTCFEQQRWTLVRWGDTLTGASAQTLLQLYKLEFGWWMSGSDCEQDVTFPALLSGCLLENHQPNINTTDRWNDVAHGCRTMFWWEPWVLSLFSDP